MQYSSVAGLVLAAGKGTRMKSELPKVLHEVFFSPMIHHVLAIVHSLALGRNYVVTGHQHQLVEESLRGYPVSFVHQSQQLGTGHAVLACEGELCSHTGPVLILCGDTPLIKTETLQQFLQVHLKSSSLVTVMTTTVVEPHNYGRIVSDEHGNIVRIVEEKDATPEQKEIREINAGIYCVDAQFLFEALHRVGTDNMQGEVYLTDIVAIAVGDGIHVHKFCCPDSEEILGVNSRRELVQAHSVLQRRYLSVLMDSGVTIIQPESVTIEKTVTIGNDSVIYPNTSLTGVCSIGSGVRVDSFVKIHACTVGDSVHIGSFTHLQQTHIPSWSIVAPHTIDIRIG
ncbi:MAG: NTP transferase domain-containing protein [Proteobacteria bacterium]|jgi:bifunctional UDP-N-acetylglucosamine pyrophosphorylase/glucosamine-1-phosphate N-acetyltransferase|nr:NTP transferase domain-containing protein [Pseudomonadota bacterium]MCG2824812.1 NTP transferase domain-containing protein [Desulfobulbaceae bacterium]MDP2001854.1 NTP transferase domain-containing protein [Desulfurivibrionaceae bacterium]PKN15745.1 MAG: glycosyl transferase family 2 [Deltaproteobacteria bacterium HGW-Deltaproteobacteria-3]